MGSSGPFRPHFTFVREILRRSRTFRLTGMSRLFATFRPETGPPEDPCAGVRQPRAGNPGGRSAAVAVAEPEPATSTQAVSR
jgi:hypothetical protein